MVTIKNMQYSCRECGSYYSIARMYTSDDDGRLKEDNVLVIVFPDDCMQFAVHWLEVLSICIGWNGNIGE